MSRAIGIVLLLLSLLAVCFAVEAHNQAHPFQDPSKIIARPHVKVHAGPLTEEDLRQGISRARSQEQYFYPAKNLLPMYGVSSSQTQCAGKTIAVIDAYGASTAQSDLQAFSTANGLPAITSANFQKVDQNGGTNYPADDTSGNWGLETALDCQAVHLFCPAAKILLVVTNSASFSDLFAGLAYAKQHAQYISMSWGGAEGSWGPSYDTEYFANSAVSFFASTGDSGSAGGIEYPSSSQYVTAVGGTSLYTNNGAFANEEGWSGSGGGCSAYTTALSVQESTAGYVCNGKKQLPDIASLADPESGIVIFMSQSTGSSPCSSPPCQWVAGGTSLASPLTAARAAIRGVQVTPSYIYSQLAASSIRDITQGSNGADSCTAGQDKVTGRGSWIGAN